MGLFEPPVSFLLTLSSVIERLAIPVTTFSLFPFETPIYDHDNGITNSAIYVPCGFLRVRAGKVVSAAFDSGKSASIAAMKRSQDFEGSKWANLT